MKKLVWALAFVIALVGAKPAEAQHVKFYYYPKSNVYYNPNDRYYWYYDQPSTKWINVQTLPLSISIGRTPKHRVYYNDRDIWRENATHRGRWYKKRWEHN